MNRRQLLLAAVLSIACCVCAQQEHTVVAMVLGKGAKKIPEIKVNGVKMNLSAPQGNIGAQEPAALVQGPQPGPATFVVGGKASDAKLAQPVHPPVMAAALVMPAPKKPKTVEEKAMDDLKLTKKEKASLFPCEDYQPYCKNYAATGQCRDVWTQKNCRKSCKLCDIPYGVFIGCQDLDVCKKFAASSCMVRWVRETCKSKCGQCGYQRQAASHITMGKKRHFPDATKKQSDKTKQAVKTKALKKVLKKMTKKAKDTVTQAAAKDKQEKKKVDKPVLRPEVAVDEKPVPKDEDEEVSKEKNDDNDNDDDDDAADEGDDASGQDASGENNSQDEDEDDDDDDDKASGENKTEDKPAAPIRMDTDPRGEPVVAKLVNQPIKFNDAPAKTMHVKLVKEAKPKVEQKKVSSDKVVKKVKQVKKVQNKDKPKKKATKSKKH